MFDNFVNLLFSIKQPIIVLLIFFFILSFYWKQIFNFFKLTSYNNIQRTHKDEVTRLGGFVIYIFFWSLWFLGLIEYKFFFNILISSIPFILVSLKEDLYHNTQPKLRLFSMVLSCLIFFYLNPLDFPIIDFPYAHLIFSFKPLNLVFFTFSIIVVMNGMNLVDGVNGLLGFTSIIQLFCLIALCAQVGAIEIMFYCYYLLVPLIAALLFNYPFGKLFFGDLGAYLYGFLISIIVIKFFGDNANILSWYAVLILFLPCYELLFSYLRKYFFMKKSPFLADDYHLHTLIFHFFRSRNLSFNLSNSLVVIFYLPFLLLTYISINFWINNILILLIIFFFYIILYSFSYFYLYKNTNKINKKSF